VPFRIGRRREGSTFRVSRWGDIDIELNGAHLATVQSVEDSEVRRELSLYRTNDGKYVLETSGTTHHNWGQVLDSSQDLMAALLDQNDYLGGLEKLLLEEAGCKDGGIRAISRIRVGADHIKDLAQAVPNASRLVRSDDLEEHVRRILDNLDNDPSQAIGSAKEMLETAGKQILAFYGEDPESRGDFPGLMKRTFKLLNLSSEDISQSARGAESMKRVFSGLNQIVAGIAELRGLYGTGHGRLRKSGLTGVMLALLSALQQLYRVSC
jgi:hypothetical protein